MKETNFLMRLAACVLIFSILTSCSGGGSESGESKSAGNASGDMITITYWTHENPAFVDIAKRFAESYSEENPNITVVHESFADQWTKVYSSLAAGTCGDVVEMYGSTLRFAQGGVLQPVPESVMSNAEIEGTFFPGALSNRLYEGKYYGLPEELNIESPGLLVNMALLRDQGVEIPASWFENLGPKTWDELMQFAHNLTIVDNGVMIQAGLGVVGGEEIAMLLSLIWQYGGDYRDPDNMRVNFHIPEAVKAAEFIMDLLSGPNAVHSATFSPRFGGFMEGTIAMVIGAPWYTAVIDQDVEGFEYEYFNLPPFVDGAKPYFVGEGGWGHWVPKSAANPEACWEFVKYMLNEDNQLEWAQKAGCLPANMKLSKNEYFITGEGRDVLGRAMQIAEFGRDPGSYTIDPATFVWDIGVRELSAITSGQVTIEEGLDSLEAQTNDMIARLAAGELFGDLEE